MLMQMQRHILWSLQFSVAACFGLETFGGSCTNFVIWNYMIEYPVFKNFSLRNSSDPHTGIEHSCISRKSNCHGSKLKGYGLPPVWFPGIAHSLQQEKHVPNQADWHLWPTNRWLCVWEIRKHGAALFPLHHIPLKCCKQAFLLIYARICIRTTALPLYIN